MIPSNLNIFITSSYYILSKKIKNKTKVCKEMIRSVIAAVYKGNQYILDLRILNLKRQFFCTSKQSYPY